MVSFVLRFVDGTFKTVEFVALFDVLLVERCIKFVISRKF